MADILLITDDLRHAERLARDLGGSRVCSVHDLYDTTGRFNRPRMIVSDIRDMGSDALMRLRRCIEAVNGADLPHLLLVHGNGARAEVQAQLLGAETLPASSATRLLSARLKLLEGAGPPETISATAARHAQAAGQFLERAFFSDAPMTPALADTGTDLIAQAIQEAGIRDWVRAVQHFDNFTHQHVLLVAGLAASFGGALGLSPRDRHLLAKAALLHDVGKTKIPTAILNKPGRLDAEELRIMRRHAELGHAMLVGANFEDAVLAVVRSHHEMLDGSGYPDGLKGDQIGDLIRLVTICDIYAALIERRPYKAPYPEAKALAILEEMTGKLDADLVRAFRPVAAKFDAAAGGTAA